MKASRILWAVVLLCLAAIATIAAGCGGGGTAVTSDAGPDAAVVGEDSGLPPEDGGTPPSEASTGTDAAGDAQADVTSPPPDAGPTLTSINLTPSNPSIAKGTTTQLTATGTFSDQTTGDLTAQVTWGSSASATATVASGATAGLVTGVAAGTATITATVGAVSGTTIVTVTTAQLTAIAVTPATPTVPRGLTKQMTATGTFSDNTTQDVTTQATWASDTPATATVNNASGPRGLVTTVAIGTAKITATIGAVAGSTTVTETAATLVSIAVTPPTPSIAKGLIQQFAATGTYSDTTTQPLTTAVTWASGTPATATISNTSGSQGLATSVAAGTTQITATLGTIVSPPVTLTVTSATLVSIAVTPGAPSIALGLTQQLVATGTYSDATTQPVTSSVTWASDTPGTATISNAAGSQGLATSVAPGTTQITASLAGMPSPPVTLTVTAATLVSIAVTPPGASIVNGLTEQFSATGTYTDTTTQPLTTAVTWASDTPATATISNAPGSEGLASSVAPGTAQITASLDGVTSPGVTLTVTAATLVSIAVTPVSPTVAIGATPQFVATGTYTDLSTQTLTTSVTWASDTPATATISNAPGSEGVATALVAGTASITASLNGITSPGDTLTVTGLYALHLGGGIVTIPGAATLNDRTLYTLEGWISEDSPGGGVYEGLLSQDHGSCCLIRMLISPTLHPFVNAGVHTDVNFNGFTFTVPTWHHWAMTCSAGVSTSWVDGTNVGTTPCVDPGDMSTASIYLGAGEGGGPYRLTGRLAEIRVSNVVRYVSAFTPQTRFATDANTMMLLHFDTGSGTTAFDSSGNGNNGTFSGTVTWVTDDRP